MLKWWFPGWREPRVGEKTVGERRGAVGEVGDWLG